MFSADAYRRRLAELEQGRRKMHRGSPRDLHRERLELLRDEAKTALKRYLAAEGDARRR
jgi:hypothetical protein